jgi:ribosomal protein S18 acetylase RimI-like enzyme
MSQIHPYCRRYEPSDRDAVRHICCETGHLGDPIDPYFGDREVFADLVTAYYTDIDPSWSLVVEVGGRVLGYLTGCADSREYAKSIPHIWRKVAAKSLARGVLVRPATAPLAWRTLVDMAIEQPTFGWYGEEFPAHLHINLLPEARGIGAGRMLIESYTELLRKAEVPGVFLETSCENTRAVSFFRAMGFEPLHTAPSPGSRQRAGGRIHVLAMGKRLT